MHVTYKKILYCALLFLVLYICTIVIRNYFAPFFTIVIVVYLAMPVFDLLKKVKILSQKANAFLSILIINLLGVFILYGFGNLIISNLFNLVRNDMMRLYENLNSTIAMTGLLSTLKMSNIFIILKEKFFNVLNTDILAKGAVYTTEGILSYFIGNIAAYFVLTDKELIFSWFEFILSDKIILKAKNSIKNINIILWTEVVLVAATTLQTILGLTALGIKNSISLGLICGVLDLLPYIGTIIIFIIIAINYILKRNFIIVVGIAALYILLQINRQILEAKLMSKNLSIHPLVMIISIYISFKIFGMIGLITGPLYVITAKEILAY